MYTGKQFKNDAGNKVFRQVECGTRQRVYMKDERVDYMLQNKIPFSLKYCKKRILQKRVLEERKGINGYRDAKKIQCNDDTTKWWQFFVDDSNYVRDDFEQNEISKKQYIGEEIPTNEQGPDPVLSNVNVESEISGSIKYKDTYIPLNQASDKKVFKVADLKSGQSRVGKTWHHGKDEYHLFLLDTAIHSAFTPHRGWASTVGSRNEMRDFIVKDDSLKKKKRRWSAFEDKRLCDAMNFYGLGKWNIIAEYVGRSKAECSQRWERFLSPQIEKGNWTEEENQKLQTLVEQYGTNRWTYVAGNMPGRSDVQCRYHYKSLNREHTILQQLLMLPNQQQYPLPLQINIPQQPLMFLPNFVPQQ